MLERAVRQHVTLSNKAPENPRCRLVEHCKATHDRKFPTVIIWLGYPHNEQAKYRVNQAIVKLQASRLVPKHNFVQPLVAYLN